MYGKIFASLYQGTLRGNAHGILVFTNLIASCDKCGIVDRHWRAIAEEVGLTVDEVKAAISYLESPDEESRSREHDGRRLVKISPDRAWGWLIVNYAKYRDMRDEEDRRIYMREYMRTRRSLGQDEAQPVNSPLTPVNSVSSVNSGKLPLAKAEAEADAEAEVEVGGEGTAPPTPADKKESKTRNRSALIKALRKEGLPTGNEAVSEWADLLTGLGGCRNGEDALNGLLWITDKARTEGIQITYAKHVRELAIRLGAKMARKYEAGP